MNAITPVDKGITEFFENVVRNRDRHEQEMRKARSVWYNIS